MAKEEKNETVKVYFTKAGNPYGCGYSAGEFGLALKSKVEDEKFKDKQGNDHVKKGLLSLGVVRMATDAEYEGYIAEQKAKLASKKASSRSVAPSADANMLMSVISEQSDRIAKLESALQKFAKSGKKEEKPEVNDKENPDAGAK